MGWSVRLAAALALALPRPVFEWVLRTLCVRWLTFADPLMRRSARANYRRILTFVGREPTDERLQAVLAEAVEIRSLHWIGTFVRPEDRAWARDGVGLEFLPLVEEARRKGRGVVLTLSNFGPFSFTLIGLLERRTPMRIPLLDRRTVSYLPDGWADSFTSIERSGREALAALDRNEMVLITTMINQLPRRMSVPLFGAPTRCAYAPAKLAVSTGAPLLPVFTLWEGDRCRAVSDGLLWPGEGPSALEALNVSLAAVQEKYIGQRPGHWMVYEDYWDLAGMDRKNATVRSLLRLTAWW